MAVMAFGNAPLVLVVEDNEDCRELLGLFLELAGYRVALASNVESALDLLRAGGVRALVTDFMLGGATETGPVLIERARRAGLLDGVATTVVYTAYPKMAATAATPLGDTPVIVVEKPHVEELRDEIDRALRAAAPSPPRDSRERISVGARASG